MHTVQIFDLTRTNSYHAHPRVFSYVAQPPLSAFCSVSSTCSVYRISLTKHLRSCTVLMQILKGGGRIPSQHLASARQRFAVNFHLCWLQSQKVPLSDEMTQVIVACKWAHRSERRQATEAPTQTSALRPCSPASITTDFPYSADNKTVQTVIHCSAPKLASRVPMY